MYLILIERCRAKFWDLRVTYNPNASDWYVALYGKNLADERFIGTWAASSALQVELNLVLIPIQDLMV